MSLAVCHSLYVTRAMSALCLLYVSLYVCSMSLALCLLYVTCAMSALCLPCLPLFKLIYLLSSSFFLCVASRRARTHAHTHTCTHAHSLWCTHVHTLSLSCARWWTPSLSLMLRHTRPTGRQRVSHFHLPWRQYRPPFTTQHFSYSHMSIGNNIRLI